MAIQSNSAGEIFLGYKREFGGCGHNGAEIPPAQKLITSLADAGPQELPPKLHLIGHIDNMTPPQAKSALGVVYAVRPNLPEGSNTSLAVSVYVAGKQQERKDSEDLLHQLWDQPGQSAELLAAITAALRDSKRVPQANEILKQMINWVNESVSLDERGEYRRSAFVAAPSMGHPLLLEWYREGIGQPGEEGWLAVKNAREVAKALNKDGLSDSAKTTLAYYTRLYAEKLTALVYDSTEKIYNPLNKSESIDLRKTIGFMDPGLAKDLPPPAGALRKIINFFTRS